MFKLDSSRHKKLPPNVKKLGWLSFFTDISGEMIFPLLPVYITIILGGNPLILGFIEGISETTSSLLKLFSGVLSDHIRKRKMLVLIGYALSSILRSCMGFATHWNEVLFFRFGDRVGKGIRTAPRDALIAASVDHTNRGHAYGFHRMMDHCGAVAGALSSAFLLWMFPGQFRMIFFLAIIPALFSLIVLFRVEEVVEGSIEKKKFSFAAAKKIPARLWFFLGLVFIFNLANSTDAFLLLRLKEGGLPDFALPLFWAAFSGMKALSNSRLGIISDRVGHGFLVGLGWLFYAFIYFVFSFEIPFPLLVTNFLVFGMFYGLTEAPEKVVVLKHATHEHYGTFFGLYHFTQSISLLPASVIFGSLWKFGGFDLAFRVSALLALFAAFGMWLWRTSPQPK
ncbi:MAG: hypothetical protein A3G32_02500 [Deltaproteobacteria bacterium RIFCSPLOWO2_12_FULL_40_28]|nr:MAG: hypothetical protein A3C45_03180 [Deltaproteobacteria bacterium RIFCSPHIGHO2_02_FULL_40_28]OGQ20695.1 MAG: hypothetical protein A3E27_10290 [Deltaproteobacteria bacterium RIFCSPHIGHO2_12_FULL_40_32]OGQ38930.1 MAG: hypothetical protein A3I69_08510 [Deltaproteobacteria bacterium RIFCSPLOWO2_02_FULL_40_36]OGQ55290.1 MAG: hypothetical protein A3G32_02500 [Deltaproteobacteria bacterium RIFCSPLOWO2_12_FULL_40_28]